MSNFAPVKILLALSATFFCFCVLELTVRLMGRTDENGDRYFRQTRFKPYHIPEASARRLMSEYQASPQTQLIYDPDLGWAPRPLVAQMNGEGYWTSGPVGELAQPASGRLRIALFGGSFTQGSYSTGWWRVVESRLRAAGIEADIMNFGVGGYGMDQAFLRWKKVQCRADIVIFGFVAGNAQDNVNVWRLLQNNSSGIPFTKPRLVMEGQGLRVLNVPTSPPSQLSDLVASLKQRGLLDREYFFRPGDYSLRWWRYSHLLALTEARINFWKDKNSSAAFYDMKKEPAQLALQITREFKREVEAEGSRFFVVHLPTEQDMRGLRWEGQFAFPELYSALKQTVTVIQPETKLLEGIEAGEFSSYFRDGHYTVESSKIIGKAVSELLIGQQRKKLDQSTQ